MSVGGDHEDMPTKWLQREGQNMLSITIIQEPLDVLFLRINFQLRDCSNAKFQRRIWSLVYQFAGVPENEQGRGTRTPLDPLDIDSPTLACSRLSDRGDGAKRYEQKNKQRGLCYYYFIYLYIFHSFAVRLLDSP